ncbi:MAG: hypothetical protein IJR97_11145 [Clostridia bacterium]|nr:hypothetical protein [Clostridia bacterium]
MKKLLILLLIVCAAAGGVRAEEGIWIEETPLKTFLTSERLDREIYPEIRLNPNGNAFPNGFLYQEPSLIYGDIDPKFICFSAPENTFLTEFTLGRADYIDPEKEIQYSYTSYIGSLWQINSPRPGEKDCIPVDGEDGKTVFLYPDDNWAYGLIDTPEYSETSRLAIWLWMGRMDPDLSREEKLAVLRDAIIPEVDRVKAELRYETFDPFWNNGEFAGCRYYNTNFPDQPLTIDFPALKMKNADGTEKEARMILTEKTASTHGVYWFGGDICLETRIAVFGRGPIVSLIKPGDKNTLEITAASGRKYLVKIDGMDKGWESVWYVSSTMTLEDGRVIEYSFTPHHMGWTGPEDITALIEAFDAAIAY